MPWYSYVSGDPANPSSYIYAGTQPPLCPNGLVLCSIYAEYSPSSNPFPAQITEPIYLDIKAALGNGAARGAAYTKA